MTGGFPVDLILFAMVAAFLVLRLRSVLGRRTGFERPRAAEPRPAGYDPRAARPSMARPRTCGRCRAAAGGVVPDPRTPPGQALARIAAADRGFEPPGSSTGPRPPSG